MVGIASLAFHFPIHSMHAEAYGDMWETSRALGIEEKTVASYDEDEVTLAAEAARKLSPAGPVGYLATATLAGPELSPTVAIALGMEEADRADFQGSTNAAGEALLSCLDYVETHGNSAILVTASVPHGALEDPREHPLGAAAAALLLTPSGDLKIEAAARTDGEEGDAADVPGGGQSHEGMKLVRETIQKAARESWTELDAVRVASHEPSGDFASQALKAIVPPERIGGGVVRLSGDTGCVSPLLALAEVLQTAQEGDPIGLVTYGGGSAVVLGLRLEARLPEITSPVRSLGANRSYLDYPTYARFRRFLARRDPETEVSQGAYVSLPAYLEFAAARYRLVASRCAACGRVDFPPRAVCLNCGDHEFVHEPLSGKGEVYARTVIAEGSSPSEFQAQQELVGPYAVALVQLDEGPKIIAQLTKTDPDGVEIGMPVEMVLRRIYRQEGVVRYGYKFRPAAAPTVVSAGV